MCCGREKLNPRDQSRMPARKENTQCTIVGLKEEKHLNGSRARVIGYNDEVKMYDVEVLVKGSSGKTMSVHAKNLKSAGSAEARKVEQKTQKNKIENCWLSPKKKRAIDLPVVDVKRTTTSSSKNATTIKNKRASRNKKVKVPVRMVFGADDAFERDDELAKNEIKSRKPMKERFERFHYPDDGSAIPGPSASQLLFQFQAREERIEKDLKAKMEKEEQDATTDERDC